MPPEIQDAIDHAAGLLARARSVVVLTGAGVSAESGIGTFRDPEEGLWSNFDPMELAHIDAFHRDPELVTRWYHWRFRKCADAKPNPGHLALAELAKSHPDLTLVTQNIDGLHQAAQSPEVIEIHGSILRWRCTRTGETIPIDDLTFETFPIPSPTGGLYRPDVVWFGEALPEDAMNRVGAALSRCECFVSVGTSSVVYPAAGFIEVARSRGASTIEINRDATPATAAVDVAIRLPSGRALPELVTRYRATRAAKVRS